LLLGGLGSNQFRTGVHEAPGGRSDVVREAHPHLAGFNVVTSDVQIEKSDVLTQKTALTAELLPFPSFLDPIQVVAYEPACA